MESYFLLLQLIWAGIFMSDLCSNCLVISVFRAYYKRTAGAFALQMRTSGEGFGEINLPTVFQMPSQTEFYMHFRMPFGTSWRTGLCPLPKKILHVRNLRRYLKNSLQWQPRNLPFSVICKKRKHWLYSITYRPTIKFLNTRVKMVLSGRAFLRMFRF